MGQVAVTLVLLAGAGLFARSLAAALNLNTGVDMDRVVTGSVALAPYGYNVARATAFFDDLRSRLVVSLRPALLAARVDLGRVLRED